MFVAMSKDKSKKSYPMKRVWVPLVVIIIALWMLNPSILSTLFRYGLEYAFDKEGLVFKADSVRGGLGLPLVVEGLSILPKNQKIRTRIVSADKIEVRWTNPLRWLAHPRRFVSRVEAMRLDVYMDCRSATLESESTASPNPSLNIPGLGTWEGLDPQSVSLKKTTMELISNNTRTVVDGMDLELNENQKGQLAAKGLFIQIGKFKKYIESVRAETAWSHGNIKLANLSLLPGIVIQEISFTSSATDSPLVTFNSSVFNGNLRGEIRLSSAQSGINLDVVALASGINLDEFPSVLDIPDKIKGQLAQGRLTFRGDSSRPADAEASLRILAHDFRWNERGWESLEIGASLIHRRLLVSNFNLKQKSNAVALDGEISIADGWAKIAESPFLINLKADIKELGSLAGLLGGAMGEASGELTANGTLRGRSGELDGFVGLKSKKAAYRTIPLDAIDVGILFRKKQVDIERCEIRSGKDVLQAKGSADLAYPHQYEAEFQTNLTDLATYLRPFNKKGADAIYEGSLGVKWQGDGNFEAHSGAFELQLSKFISAATPAGLTGQFVGTYSPNNIYFSKLEIENNKLKLRSQAALASTGVNLKDLQLAAGKKPLLEGAAFFPVNPFSIWTDSNWLSSILDQKNIYLEATTPNEIDIQDLIRLAGQKFPMRGLLKLNLQASGPAAAFDSKGWIKVRDMAFQNAGDNPLASLEVDMQSGNGTASIDSRLLSKGMNPVTISSQFPLGLFKKSDSTIGIVNEEAPIEVDIQFPKADLSLLSPFFSGLHGLTGEVSGGFKISQTFSHPVIQGTLDIKNGAFSLDGYLPRIESIKSKINLVGNDVLVEQFSGVIQAGTIESRGHCRLTDPSNPEWDFVLKGSRLPLPSNSFSSLFIDLDVSAKGTSESGLFSGNVVFVNSKISRVLAGRPVLNAEKLAASPLLSLADTFAFAAPNSQWQCNLQVTCREPILLTGQKLAGEIIPSLYLQGAVENPIPVGRLSLRNVDFHMPAGTFVIQEGVLEFLSDAPWNPLAFVEAQGWFRHHRVDAVLFGSLQEQKWVLDSLAGSMNPQELFLLVDRGLYPASEDSEWPVPDFSSTGKMADFIPNGVVFGTRLGRDAESFDGWDFSQSLNGENHQTILPVEAFLSGYEWGLR